MTLLYINLSKHYTLRSKSYISYCIHCTVYIYGFLFIYIKISLYIYTVYLSTYCYYYPSSTIHLWYGSSGESIYLFCPKFRESAQQLNSPYLFPIISTIYINSIILIYLFIYIYIVLYITGLNTHRHRRFILVKSNIAWPNNAIDANDGANFSFIFSFWSKLLLYDEQDPIKNQKTGKWNSKITI